MDTCFSGIFARLQPGSWISEAEITVLLEQRINDCRKRRLEEAVYKPRRKLLVDLYYAYVRQPAPEGAAIELLPSITDLDYLPDFDTIIKLPEGTDVNGETFKPTVERLPALVQEWRAGVDAQFAALVVIPPELSTDGVSADQVADQKSMLAERLRLTSAVFNVPSSGVLWMFPDFLAPSMFHTRYYSSRAGQAACAKKLDSVEVRRNFGLFMLWKNKILDTPTRSDANANATFHESSPRPQISKYVWVQIFVKDVDFAGEIAHAANEDIVTGFGGFIVRGCAREDGYN
ncbi:hypothetical protein PAXINDRAFT_9109 [Paxillus involutus ATCC 200175]|nr:hypothetical protein PAXINDRAFT_9109 [Paxillus involutus ATCC 200175]